MKIPNKFDAIRPYEPEDLQEVYDKLFADPMFHGVLDMLYPGVCHDELEKNCANARVDTNMKSGLSILSSSVFLQNVARDSTWIAKWILESATHLSATTAT